MLNKKILPLLSCPDCQGEVSVQSSSMLWCKGCSRSFDVTEDNIICMLPSQPKPLPDAYNDPNYKRMCENFDDSSSYFTEGNSIFSAIHASSHKKIEEWRLGESSQDQWVCDLGCGQGYHFQFMADLNNVIGIDMRLDSLRKIRRQSSDVTLIQGNLCSLPLKTGAISQLISVYALEHIYYLEDALKEASRLLSSDGNFYVGVPCEGGLAWTLGREVTSMRTMSKKYNLNYRKYIALEHCNTISDIDDALGKFFSVMKTELFPLSYIPFYTTNLTASFVLKKRPDLIN